MKLAIMQPYFFPYVGYFKLIGSVDKFVFYDDVDFIKNGWINRNRIFVSGKVGYMTIPLLGASSNQKICDVQTQKKSLWVRKLTEAVKQNYSKAQTSKRVSSCSTPFSSKNKTQFLIMQNPVFC